MSYQNHKKRSVIVVLTIMMVLFARNTVIQNQTTNIKEQIKLTKINQDNNNDNKKDNTHNKDDDKHESQLASRHSNNRKQKFIATGYDLSKQCCGKVKGQRGYGITATNKDLRGLNREQAKTIAVDPKIIPLHSKVYVEFIDEEYKHWSGVYIASDTGKAIKNNKIDIFIGDFDQIEPHKETLQFGVRDVYVTILEN